MANRKEKKTKKQIIIEMIPFLIIGIFLAKAIHIYNMGGSDKFFDFLNNIDLIISPLYWFNALELLMGIAVSIIIKILVKLLSAEKKNFKHGSEYGSAHWGTATDIAPYIDKNPYHNILLSATEKLSMEGRMPNMEHNRNKNVEIVGGSGSGKTYSYVTPNILQCDCSYVVTDPKGTILENVGWLMRHKGYKIKVLNTIDFSKSMHYNPFVYIKTEEDILSTVSQMFEALKAEDAGTGGDPFWNDAAEMFLTSIFALIYYEAPPEEQNMSTFLEFFNSYEVSEDDENFKNGVDLIFDELEAENPDHFAVRQYKKFKMAAGKTAKSILITVGAKIAPFDIGAVREIMMDDEMELDMLGERKQILFVIVSDTNKRFNFIPALLYSQMFNTLCRNADNIHHGRLPVHVRCILDEFANLGRIKGFEILISTMRSREVSAEIILQSKNQLKAIYKDNAETIEDNCDTFVFLGGKGKTTLEDLEKNLGEETIDLFNESDSRGMSPSKGINYNKVGHKLMSQFELGIMPRSKCIVQISGVPPFYSDKYPSKNHPNYKYLADSDKKYYFDIVKYLKAERNSKKIKFKKEMEVEMV